jgi:hypothetical protein
MLKAARHKPPLYLLPEIMALALANHFQINIPNEAHPTTTCPKRRPHAAAVPLRLADPGIGRASYLDVAVAVGGKIVAIVIRDHLKCENIT